MNFYICDFFLALWEKTLIMQFQTIYQLLDSYAHTPLNDEFEKLLQIKTFEKKQLILKQGSFCSKIWFLNSGIIRLFRNQNNIEKTFHLFTTPHFFSDLIALHENTASFFNIQALDITEVIEIDALELEMFLAENIEFDRVARKIYQHMVYEESLRVFDIMFRNAEERYKHFYCLNKTVIQKIPQKIIASYLDMKPETLSRIKKKIIKGDCP